jgi:hypothetical protein
VGGLRCRMGRENLIDRGVNRWCGNEHTWQWCSFVVLAGMFLREVLRKGPRWTLQYSLYFNLLTSKRRLYRSTSGDHEFYNDENANSAVFNKLIDDV